MEEHTNGLALAVARPTAIAQVTETTTAHSSAMAKAEVEARFAVAVGRPRMVDESRMKLLGDCRRPHFAEMARYSVPRGGKAIEGPSIRFVEAALRALGNVDVRTPTVFEDGEKRIVRVTVCDLESNSTYSTDIVVSKTVERRSLKNGQTAVGKRTNSYGETVYIVESTDDELLVKQAALISKAIRTLGLRIIPGDLVDEAMETALATMRQQDKADPDAARKRLLDAFVSRGVRPRDLEEFLGHPLDVIPANEIEQLRAIYAAIRDGHTTWSEVIAERRGEGEKPTSKVDAAKAKLGKKSTDVPEDLASAAAKIDAGEA